MGLINTWFFQQKIILWDVIAEATKNQFRVVAVRDYTDKKGKLPDGLTLTLMVLHDDYDYGIDKSGKPRENNLYTTFDATVLTRAHTVKKGDIVKLLDFDVENSFAINFDMILRFRDLKVLQPQGGSANP